MHNRTNWLAFTLLTTGLFVPQTAWCDDVMNQLQTNTNNGLTVKASTGLSTPTIGQNFTAYAVYVTVASDSKHYVALNGSANTSVSAIFWQMKIKCGATTLAYNASVFQDGHTWNLDENGNVKHTSTCSYGVPLGVGSYSASAEGWIEKGSPSSVGATAPTHTHNFTVTAPVP